MENRSMKRKQKNFNKDKVTVPENEEIIRFAKVLGIVIVVVIGVYFFTRAFVTKDLFKKEKPAEENNVQVNIDYNVTLLGALFTRPYKDYYVIVYDSTNKRADYYNIIVKMYRDANEGIKLYYADLGTQFNKPFYTEDKSNYQTNSLDGLKVRDITLIKISDKKIVQFIEDEEKIASELKPKEK